MGEERAEELRTAVGDFLKAEAGTAGPVAGIAGPAADNVAVVAGEIAGPKELERAVAAEEERSWGRDEDADAECQSAQPDRNAAGPSGPRRPGARAPAGRYFPAG